MYFSVPKRGGAIFGGDMVIDNKIRPFPWDGYQSHLPVKKFMVRSQSQQPEMALEFIIHDETTLALNYGEGSSEVRISTKLVKS